MSCTVAVVPGAPSSSMRQAVALALKVSDCTVAPDTVTAEGGKGTMGLEKAARRVKLELASKGACCTVSVAWGVDNMWRGREDLAADGAEERGRHWAFPQAMGAEHFTSTNSLQSQMTTAALPSCPHLRAAAVVHDVEVLGH